MYDKDSGLFTGTNSVIRIEKNKFSPSVGDINIFIDDRVGGRIITDNEACSACYEKGIIKTNGGWYKFDNGYPEGSFRWDSNDDPSKNILGNPLVRKVCVERLTNFYRENYISLDRVYKELEIDVAPCFDNIYTDQEINKEKEEDSNVNS